MNTLTHLLAASFITLGAVSATQAAQVKVTITNNSPTGGVAITPVWVGFHDGSFDSYDGGTAASGALERIAEDGNASHISTVFSGTLVPTGSTVGNRVQGAVGNAPIAAGASVTETFDLSGDMDNVYFSYVSMVLPSNDYFIANGNPLAHSLHDLFANGNSISFNIGTPGTVNDAGTEVNDFTTSAGNGLFTGLPPMQSGPNTGADENGVIQNVANPFGSFLNTPAGVDLSRLNFNSSSLYPNGIATVTISSVPVPAAVWMMGSGLLGLLTLSRRKSAHLA